LYKGAGPYWSLNSCKFYCHGTIKIIMRGGVQIAKRILNYMVFFSLRHSYFKNNYKEYCDYIPNAKRLYSQHFIFFETCKRYNKLDCLSWQVYPAKCNITLYLNGPLCKLQEKWVVLNIVPRTYSHNTSFSLYFKNGSNKLERYITLAGKMLATDKHCRLMGPITSY
jgi:hypothetical protein